MAIINFFFWIMPLKQCNYSKYKIRLVNCKPTSVRIRKCFTFSCIFQNHWSKGGVSSSDLIQWAWFPYDYILGNCTFELHLKVETKPNSFVPTSLFLSKIAWAPSNPSFQLKSFKTLFLSLMMRYPKPHKDAFSFPCKKFPADDEISNKRQGGRILITLSLRLKPSSVLRRNVRWTNQIDSLIKFLCLQMNVD